MIESRMPESLPEPRNLRDHDLDGVTGGRNPRPRPASSWLVAIAQAMGEIADKQSDG